MAATVPLLSIELYQYGYEPFFTSFTPTSTAASLLFKVRYNNGAAVIVNTVLFRPQYRTTSTTGSRSWH